MTSKRDFYEAVYDMLIQEGQIRTNVHTEWGRKAFVTYFLGGGIEWRFQGSLGFGGKFYRGYQHYVSCYPEDRSPKTDKVITRLNANIRALEGLFPLQSTEF